EHAERARDPAGPVEDRRRYGDRALDPLVLADRETSLSDQCEVARVFPRLEIDLGQRRTHVGQDRLPAGAEREPFAIADAATEAQRLVALHLGDAQPKRSFR